MSERLAIRAEGEALLARFTGAGALEVDADLLQPAGTLLDLYGEDIRARAYVTHDPDLGEMMLRPDFTVPVVQRHMDEGAEPARYTYLGEVFRMQAAGSNRARAYMQVGYELFDRDDPARSDAEVFALISGALSGLGLRPVTGDIGVITAAVESLATSDMRKAALMRHIWRPRRFRALLDRYTGRAEAPQPRKTLLAGLAEKGAEALIAKASAPFGLRGPEEVLRRLKALEEDAATPSLSRAEAEVLDAILTLRETLPNAFRHLCDIAVDLPGLTPTLEQMEARMEALAAAGIDVESLPFEASYGRTTMEYYDGFVFGFLAEARPDLPAIATGGRYDALTRVLGQGRAIPAVGGVIRPGLVHHLRGGAA